MARQKQARMYLPLPTLVAVASPCTRVAHAGGDAEGAGEG